MGWLRIIKEDPDVEYKYQKPGLPPPEGFKFFATVRIPVGTVSGIYASKYDQKPKRVCADEEILEEFDCYIKG